MSCSCKFAYVRVRCLRCLTYVIGRGLGLRLMYKVTSLLCTHLRANERTSERATERPSDRPEPDTGTGTGTGGIGTRPCLLDQPFHPLRPAASRPSGAAGLRRRAPRAARASHKI